MAKRRIYDDELHAQFVTFSCYPRRRLLDHPRARQIVMATLASELNKHAGTCCGFVVMPDHVHAIVWFPEAGRPSRFTQVWKSRASRQLKRFVRGQLGEYSKSFDVKQPFWQPKYYPFNLYTEKKAREKLDSMHLNPVRAGLVEQACDWQWSSARYCQQGKSVGATQKCLCQPRKVGLLSSPRQVAILLACQDLHGWNLPAVSRGPSLPQSGLPENT